MTFDAPIVVATLEAVQGIVVDSGVTSAPSSSRDSRSMSTLDAPPAITTTGMPSAMGLMKATSPRWMSP